MEVAKILFNHKPFLQKELNYFSNAFEDPLIKKQILFEELEKSTRNLCDETVPSCIIVLDDCIGKLNAKVSRCCELSQRVLTLDQKELSDEEFQDNFSPEEDEFIKNINIEKEEIENSFEESVSQLRNEYDKMEKQLLREKVIP